MVPRHQSRRGTSPDRAELTARPDDQTLDGYIERLGRTLAGRITWCSSTKSRRCRRRSSRRQRLCCDGPVRPIGMPAGGANLTLIAGDYRLTPFGLHKDEADILTFVVRGRKRLLLWPFEDLCGALGAPDASRAAPFVAPTDFDLSPWRSRAVVLEGTAGDVLAWPREWWHVAEDGADAPVTLALGLVRTADPLRFVARAASDRWRAGSGVERPFRTPRGGQYPRSLLADLTPRPVVRWPIPPMSIPEPGSCFDSSPPLVYPKCRGRSRSRRLTTPQRSVWPTTVRSPGCQSRRPRSISVRAGPC